MTWAHVFSRTLGGLVGFEFPLALYIYSFGFTTLNRKALQFCKVSFFPLVKLYCSISRSSFFLELNKTNLNQRLGIPYYNL